MRRRSGRTTRMLQEAIDRAHAGAYVLVASASFQHEEQLVRQLLELLGKSPFTYNKAQRKFHVGEGLIRLRSAKANNLGGAFNFDWFRQRFLGEPVSTVTLVDHYAIETEFAAVLEMLHRWDAPKSTTVQTEHTKHSGGWADPEEYNVWGP